MKNKLPSIVLIGAGNVAHHLGHRFQEMGIPVLEVFSRKITKARKLAKAIGASATNQLSAISKTADLYILAVHDDAIEAVARQLPLSPTTGLVVHTSGAMPSKVLKPFFKNYGCFYPLQTFSIQKAVDFEVLPLCIFSPQQRNRQKLTKVAKAICPNVYTIDDAQKSVLHVAAVFVNNFTNHLCYIAKEITDQQGIDFDILKPLLNETASKLAKYAPKEMQTGPAIRGDQQTMNKHLQLLESHPEWAQLYKLLSQSIAKTK